MKKCSSVVWRFFERIIENKRCVAVMCKLCETQYKFFGNTTNLRAHLINKHPIQWELAQSGTLEDSHFQIIEENTTSTPSTTKKRKYASRGHKDRNVRYSILRNNEESHESGAPPKFEIQRYSFSICCCEGPGEPVTVLLPLISRCARLSPDVDFLTAETSLWYCWLKEVIKARIDVLENSDSDQIDHDATNEATINLVRQMHADNNSDEEWLEEDPYQITHIETYEPTKKKMKYKKVKREVASPTGLPGFYVAPKANKTIIYEEPKRDEYSVFGEYVANKLRKFDSPRTRGNLQQLITTILWQAEYGLYDNADVVKRVLMYSVQSPEPEPEPAGTVEFGQPIHMEEIIVQSKDADQSNETICE